MTETTQSSQDEENPAGGLGEDPETLRHPQPMMAMMRDMAPVVSLERHGQDVTLVATHEDVLTVLRNPDIFSSGSDAVQIGQIRPLIPLQIDPPEHAKYRKLIDPLFAPKRIALLEAPVRALVRELIDSVVDDGHVNFHSAIAEPFPSTVFLELLGLPASRVDEFIVLKDGIIRPDGDTPEELLAAVNATGAKIYAVLEEVVDARIAKRGDDFISGFLDSEVDGDQLTREDVIDICYLFFLAGLDTVTASLDCLVAFLAQHPGHRQQILDKPELLPSAIEEMMRWETPVTGVARIAREDTELSGCPIAKGTPVAPLLLSANTDERFWDDADTIDFDREINKHLTFGGGVHRCMGSHLARMELRVALEEWHARVPNYRVADGVELEYSASLRQVENLELVW
ncbi:MAG: cytochrome P450 [Ilumatobacteraceae bacterium]|nr:cytochrome P450 [Ilumatobacteraceae bacterium]